MPYVYGAAMEMAVVFSIPYVLNVIGRRWTLITMFLAAMTSSFAYVFAPPSKSSINFKTLLK